MNPKPARHGRKGFTILELLLVLGFFGILSATVFSSLSGLLADNPLKDGQISAVDSLRRAVTQSMAGYYGDTWGVHFSDSDGCVLPATKFHIFRGQNFTSATDTIDTIDLPTGARVSAIAVGGGCDVKFARFHGSTTSTGTITLSNQFDATRTITINQYGKIETQ